MKITKYSFKDVLPEKKRFRKTQRYKQEKFNRFLKNSFLAIVTLIGVNAILINSTIELRPTPQVVFAKEKKVEVVEPTMKQWVLARLEAEGVDAYEAFMIIQCESRWNPNALGVNKDHSIDMGLWQINTRYHKTISNADKLDYKKATDYAIELYKKSGWKPWVCAGKLGIK